jgi:hypothetical protein
MLLPATEALSSAGSRFDRAAKRMVEAASSGDLSGATNAIVDMAEAEAQFKGATAVVRFSSEMWDALLEIGRD